MGAKKDMGLRNSRLTQEEVDAFCEEWGIDSSFNPVAPVLDKSTDQCPPGFIALYCHHFVFSNLHYPFTIFVLNLLEYYRISFGQIHPHGFSRVLHFEILCRALGYDPSSLMFQRFFRLAKSCDWFTYETPHIDVSMSRTCAYVDDQDDTSDVVLGDAEAIEGEDAGGKYVNGKWKKGKELPLVVGKKGKSEGKKVVVSAVKGSPGKSREGSTDLNPRDMYVPDWSVKIGDNFRSSAVCEDVLTHFAPPMVWVSLSAMDDDSMIFHMLMSACNFASMLPKGVSHFRKRTHEYEEFSKKIDKMKASMAAFKKENEGSAEKEKTLLSKVADLTSKHEVDMNELRKRLEADKLQVKAYREALDVQRKAFLEEKEG
ncbi:hypothetical protein HanOQP8_Chr16g0615171 [Helianthus annuus]|nr:hypothetical protein HanOQP8_Chr16g0615171 [Helianthus annuus]